MEVTHIAPSRDEPRTLPDEVVPEYPPLWLPTCAQQPGPDQGRLPGGRRSDMLAMARRAGEGVANTPAVSLARRR